MKKLEKKTLTRAWARWYFGGHNSLSYEWLETFGFLDSMTPVIRELYADNPEEERAALVRHCAFYCTEPQMGSIINGIACGMEEQRANGKDVDDEVINGLKVGLMGPVAGIGDSMIPGMLIPLLMSVALGLTGDGSPFGALLYVAVYVPLVTALSYFLFFRGYDLGTRAMDLIVGEVAQRVRGAFNMLGVIVIGGVAASYVSLSTVLQFDSGNGEAVVVDDVLNGIFPSLLPLAAVLFCWWLISKRRVSAIKVMLLLVVVAVVGVCAGVL